MFPRERSTDPDPYNPPLDPHQPPSSSSASTSTICAENASLFLHPHHHHPQHHHHLQQQEKQQQSLSSTQPWPPISHYSATDMASRSAERLMIEGFPRQQFMQGTSTANFSREEAAQLLFSGSASSHAMQFQGLSMMPSAVEQFYNEQLLRSFNSKAAETHFSGIEPRSIYENLQASQELQMVNQGSSSVLSRTLENIGRSAPVNEPAAVRYEETCTPRPRWCPTQEQIQILESLFNSGTTTPSRDMIVDIAAQLRKYGTIAEANVFYWFQNRKARAKRKLQPPPPPLQQASLSATVSTSLNPDHQSTESAHIANTSTNVASADHTQSKSRRVSLKQTSASSPTSSTSPDHLHVAAGPASPSPLQQQPTKSSLHQETLLVSNRGANVGNPLLQSSHISTPSLYSWHHQQQHLERLPAEEGSESAASTLSSYPHSLLRRHGAESQLESFQQLLEYPRISLSLAPPTQHKNLQSSQLLSHTQPGVLGCNTPSNQQFLQATSKGEAPHTYLGSVGAGGLLGAGNPLPQSPLARYAPPPLQKLMMLNTTGNIIGKKPPSEQGIMLYDPQDSLGGGPIIGSSSCTTSSSAFFSQLGTSKPVPEIVHAEFNPLQADQLPQSSLPLARPGDYQRQEAARLSSSTAEPQLPEGDQEQLPMWEELDPCGPWSVGQSHH